MGSQRHSHSLGKGVVIAHSVGVRSIFLRTPSECARITLRPSFQTGASY